MANSAESLDAWFGSKFLKGYAKNLITNWEFALIELIANSYDAGASNVRITLPKTTGELFIIEDNGIGMTKDEFLTRWKCLGYDRISEQGEVVYYPSGEKTNRIPYGKNGKGRFAMYCFSNKYYVETWRNGLLNKFMIEKGDTPFLITHLEELDYNAELSGTKIYTTFDTMLPLFEKEVIDLVCSKFWSDPSFVIFINEREIVDEDIGNLIINETIHTSEGDVGVKIIKTKPGRNTQLNGIAWWVNHRRVGNLTWKLSDGEKLDGRYREARLYVFIIIADILQDDVKDDWTDFEATKRFENVHEAISNYLKNKLDVLFSEKRKARKRAIIKPELREIRNLNPISRERVNTIIDEIIKNCPHLRDSDLENILHIVIELEKSTSKFALLEKMATLESTDFDGLNDIITHWEIQDAKLILSEIKTRLDLITFLEKLTEEKSDEVHELLPFFKQSLWIFGVEYDSSEYTANETLTTVIQKFFDKTSKKTNRLRPDIVSIADRGIISVYNSDKFTLDGEYDGFDRILIIELKRGGLEIGLKEIQQVQKYALYLNQEGHIPPASSIICYVLGTTLDSSAKKNSFDPNITIIPYSYHAILNMAKKRLFNLKEKIEKNKRILE